MRKMAIVALACAAAVPEALPAEPPAMLPIDWSLEKAALETKPVRHAQAARLKALRQAGQKAGIRAGAQLTNKTGRGGKKARVGVALPF